MTTDQPTESEAEVPASSPEQPPTDGSGHPGEVVMTIDMPEPICLHCGGGALRGPSAEPEVTRNPDAIRDARADVTAAVRAMSDEDGEGLAAILNGVQDWRETAGAAIDPCASAMSVLPEEVRAAILQRWADAASAPDDDAA